MFCMSVQMKLDAKAAMFAAFGFKAPDGGVYW